MSANYWTIFVSCVLGCLLVRSGLAEEGTMTEKEGNDFKFVAESVVKDGYLSNGYLYADEWVLQSFGAVSYYGFCLSA